MGIPTVDVTQDSLQAAQLAAQASQLAVTTAQLGVMTSQLAKLFEIVAGGTQIANILRDSQSVLQGISDEIKKAQETVAPIIALVVEVEKIGQIIKGDVGLNLGALVDATKGISDTLKGSIGINISDAISAGSNRIADLLSDQTKTQAATGQQQTEQTKSIADHAGAIAEALRINSPWTKITNEEFKRAVSSTTCPEWLAGENEASAFIRGIMATISKTGGCLFELLYGPFIEALRDVITLPFQTASRVIFDELNKQFPVQEVDPRTVQEHGIQLLTEAFTVGIGAHAIAVAGEAAFPGQKNIGLGQIAALLVDVSGFAPIARALVGEKITASLTIPMRYNAQRSFRPILPNLRESMEAWAKLGLSDNDFHELLRWHGIPEAFHPMFFEVATREPRFLELATAFDDVEVSEAWLVRAIQREGFRGEDVEQIHKAIAARANRTFKKDLVDELVAVVKDGLHDVSWLQANLRTLGLRPQTIALISSTATLTMTRAHTNDLAKVWQTKAEQEVITLAEYRVALVSLGFTSTSVSAKVALVDAKLRGKVVKQEKAQIESVVRKTQAERSQRAIQLFRRGIISDDQLHAALVGLGFVEAQAQAIVDLEAARRLPANKPTVDHEAQATQRAIIDARKDATLSLLRTEQINADQAFVMLVSLGLDPDLASALVERELARLKPPASVVKLTLAASK